MPNNLFFGAPDGDQALDGPTKAETNRHVQRIAGVMLGDSCGLTPSSSHGLVGGLDGDVEE